LHVALKQDAWIDAKKERNQNEGNSADATTHDPAARDAKVPAVFDVLAFLFFVETHKRPPFAGKL
jgi:hypothetical protein